MRAHAPGDHLSALILSGHRERIARELEPLVRRMVASVLRTSDRDLIESATSDTLLAVCRHHTSFRGRSRATTWLYTIARRASLRVVRKDRAHALAFDPAGVDSGFPPSVPPAAFVSRNAWTEFRAAVPHAGWRRVWLMANLPGVALPIPEIARRTGYTAGSVAVILSRVRRKLAVANAYTGVSS